MDIHISDQKKEEEEEGKQKLESRIFVERARELLLLRTLIYINSLSISFFTSIFFIIFYFLSPNEDSCRKNLCLIDACISPYSCIHLSRAVLYCFFCSIA